MGSSCCRARCRWPWRGTSFSGPLCAHVQSRCAGVRVRGLDDPGHRGSAIQLRRPRCAVRLVDVYNGIILLATFTTLVPYTFCSMAELLLPCRSVGKVMLAKTAVAHGVDRHSGVRLQLHRHYRRGARDGFARLRGPVGWSPGVCLAPAAAVSRGRCCAGRRRLTRCTTAIERAALLARHRRGRCCRC